MQINSGKIGALLIFGVGCWCQSALGQVVRVAPVIKLVPTPAADARLPGIDPPASEAQVEVNSVFYIEIWATNSGVPLNGLACVYVDLFYDRTDLVDAVPPQQDSSLFPINAVAVVFDDATGSVGDTGGCQGVPAIQFLGVDEWVLVERIQMNAVQPGGPVAVSVADAENIIACTSIIGNAFCVGPADVDFQTKSFVVISCTGDIDCDDANPCTDDACDPLGGCVNTPNDLNSCDDGDACTENDSCSAGECSGVPVECPEGETCDPKTGECVSECGPCPTDVDGDGDTEPFDLAFLLGNWGPITPESQCLDADSNGSIGTFDLAFLLGNWGPCP